MEKTCCCNTSHNITNGVKRLQFTFFDLFKVLYAWLFGFGQFLSMMPGLYYTGTEYNKETPLLVTCNYILTVYLLWNVIRKRNVRILIIDTKGINVWCSSGKGQFNAQEITKQIKRYPFEALTNEKKLEIILPKLSLSGVSLEELKKEAIIPRIGPIYRHDLPVYLDKELHSDRRDDKYQFNLRDRLYILIPTLLQFTGYLIVFSAVMFLWNLLFTTKIYWQPLAIGILINILYIAFFPLLPTRNFSIKGIVLGIIFFIVILLYMLSYKDINVLSLLFYFLYTIGTGIWFGLYFTGNSGVSNYSLVKAEIIRFLPIAVVMLFFSVVILIIKGVIQ